MQATTVHIVYASSCITTEYNIMYFCLNPKHHPSDND